MKRERRWLVLFQTTAITWIISVLLWPHTVAYGESVSQRYSALNPTSLMGQGEFVHGQEYGKLLIQVTIVGAIGQQGIHHVPEGTDLLFALLYAGGATPTTDLTNIVIRRRHQSNLLKVNLDESINEGNVIPVLRDGDIVKVSYSWKQDISTVMMVTSLLSVLSALTFASAAVFHF